MPTLTDIISTIELQQAKQKHCIDIINIIEPVLKSFDGKTISKRIETAIKKVLPEYRIYYGKTYSWYTIRIWENGLDYNSSIELNLGYIGTNNDIFDFEKYVYNNQRHYLDKSRYEELERFKDSTMLTGLINRYQELQTDIEIFKKNTSNLPYPVSQYFKLL